MGKHLDLDDVAATSELATKELAELRATLAKAREALRRHIPHESFKAFKEDGRWFIHVGDDVCEVSEQAIELDAFDAVAQLDGAQTGEEGKESK